MYRIIERGAIRVGPRRAFLFAQDFNLNLDIPMSYAVDYTDPDFRKLMNLYFENGGSKDLVCCINYFLKSSDDEKISTTTLSELLYTSKDSSLSLYTKEEKNLHTRFVNVLSNTIELDNERKRLL